jgi:hypothetical protein
VPTAAGRMGGGLRVSDWDAGLDTRRRRPTIPLREIVIQRAFALGLLLTAAVWAAGVDVGRTAQPPANSSNRSPFSFGVQLGLTNGYNRWGGFVGPMVEYSPLPWLGIRASACYENDIYLFFKDYRVNGALLSADVCFRWWRLTASLGTNMDYYFAPVVEKRIHGWHAEVGLRALNEAGFSAVFSIGYVNRIDPRYFSLVCAGYSDRAAFGVLLADIPRTYLQLTLSRGESR